MTETPKTDDKTVAILLECDLDAPIEKVWRALSDPAIRSQWLLEAGLAGRRDAGGEVQADVLESQQNQRLRLSWTIDGTPAAPGLDTVVTFEIEPRDHGGTHLRLVHEGFVVPAHYPVDAISAEPEIVVYLPIDAIARRRIRRPRRVAISRRGMMPTTMRLAA